MKRHVRMLPLLPLALALVAAAPAAAPPDELVRRGNDALGRKQYDKALELYGGAEEQTLDPGLVAFNEGVALYQKEDYAAAEARFRMARQGAAGPRRAGSAYNLAACLLQTAGERDVAKLAEAIGLFEECLRSGDPDDRLAADARHNLELAKLLWAQAKARPAPKDNNEPNDDDSQPPPQKHPDDPKATGSDDGSGNPQKGGERVRVGPEQGRDAARSDQQPLPGEGNLQAIPDTDELKPMSKEEAEAHLKQAVQRVTQEGQAHRRQTLRVPSGKVRDW